MINDHPDLAGKWIPRPIGEAGFDLPEFSALKRVSFEELSEVPNLEMRVLPVGTNNWAYVPADYRPPHLLRIRINPRTCDTTLVFGAQARVFGQLTLNCTNGLAVFSGRDVGDCSYSVELNGSDTTFFIGSGSSSNGLKAHVVGEKTSIVIGEGLLGAHDVTVLTSDMHALIDATTGAWINHPKEVVIGPHVWLADSATMLKGSSIGFGSVLGYGSVLSGAVGAYMVAAGTPAKVVKQNVTWLTPSVPNPKSRESLAEIRERCGYASM